MKTKERESKRMIKGKNRGETIDIGRKVLICIERRKEGGDKEERRGEKGKEGLRKTEA